MQGECDPQSPLADHSRFEEAFVSAHLKEQFEAEFWGDEGGEDRGRAFEPDWRVDGIPVQPNCGLDSPLWLGEGAEGLDVPACLLDGRTG